MMKVFETETDFVFKTPLNRRDLLRIFLSSCGLLMANPLANVVAGVKTNGQTIIDRFLGEELIYNIGFWLFSHCGNARTKFEKTDLPGIYRLSLEGHSVGFIDFLVGKLRYAYHSYAEFSADDDHLRPVFFQIDKKRAGKAHRRSIIFNYAAKEIIFSKAGHDEQTEVRRESMKTERRYEDYLTLFYNFRYGYYGPLNQGATYRLPVYIRKKMKSLTAQISDHEQEKKQRQKEADRSNKDFFIKFQVAREDVSSGSGQVEGWLSSDAIPVKGTIKDVVFFGDLYGELVEKRSADPGRIAIIPKDIKTLIQQP